jgi:hypothetical protein
MFNEKLVIMHEKLIERKNSNYHDDARKESQHVQPIV